LEYPFAEDDWASWSAFMQKGTNVEILGDDLMVTNVERVQVAIEKRACNGL
jgi:enolase